LFCILRQGFYGCFSRAGRIVRPGFKHSRTDRATCPVPFRALQGRTRYIFRVLPELSKAPP
jgi:hypothetical protein